MLVICYQKVGAAANSTVNKFLIVLVGNGKVKAESWTDEDHVFGSKDKEPELLQQLIWKDSLQNLLVFKQNGC